MHLRYHVPPRARSSQVLPPALLLSLALLWRAGALLQHRGPSRCARTFGSSLSVHFVAKLQSHPWCRAWNQTGCSHTGRKPPASQLWWEQNTKSQGTEIDRNCIKEEPNEHKKIELSCPKKFCTYILYWIFGLVPPRCYGTIPWSWPLLANETESSSHQSYGFPPAEVHSERFPPGGENWCGPYQKPWQNPNDCDHFKLLPLDHD